MAQVLASLTDEVYFGPFGSANRTLAAPELLSNMERGTWGLWPARECEIIWWGEVPHNRVPCRRKGSTVVDGDIAETV